MNRRYRDIATIGAAAEDISRRIEYCTIEPEPTTEKVREKCNCAKEKGFWAINVLPEYIQFASGLLLNQNINVTSVIAYPDGFRTLESKIHEAKQAVSNGVDFLELYVNTDLIKKREFEKVQQEIETINEIVHQTAVLRVTLDTNILVEKAEKAELIDILIRSGTEEIKVASGAGGICVDPNDIELVYQLSAGKIRIKADGGIRTKAKAIELIEAGATYIGTSSKSLD